MFSKKEETKSQVFQKPFRCPADLDVRLNRAKGALMMKTGERISDNQFIIDLLELGLKSLKSQIDQEAAWNQKHHYNHPLCVESWPPSSLF